MKTTFNNWILNKYDGHFTIESNDYPQFYIEKLATASVPLGENGMTINWDQMIPRYSFLYEFEGSIELVRAWLNNSALIKHKEIIIEFGYNQPIVAFETKCFIENWYEIASWEGFVGTICFSPDCKQIIEFSDRREYNLYSNFEIQPPIN